MAYSRSSADYPVLPVLWHRPLRQSGVPVTTRNHHGRSTSFSSAHSLNMYGDILRRSNPSTYSDDDGFEDIPQHSREPSAAKGGDAFVDVTPESTSSEWTDEKRFSDRADVEDVVSSRLGYVDGLRLLAALQVMTASVLATSTADYKLAGSVLNPFRSALGLQLFFVICGRVLARPWITSRGSDRAAFSTVGPAIAFRVVRFLVPLLVISGAQWLVARFTGMSATNAAFDVLFGTTRPEWRFASFGRFYAFVASSFSNETVAAQLQVQGTMLFTLPWLLQGSFYVLTLNTFFSIIPAQHQQVLLALLALINWCTLPYLTPFLLGYALALCAEPSTHEPTPRRKFIVKVFKVLVGPAALAIIVPLQFTSGPRLAFDRAFATLHVFAGVEEVTTLSTAFPGITASDILSAAALLTLVEAFRFTRVAFGVLPLRLAGRHLAFGITLVHPIVIYAVLPAVLGSTSAADVQASLGAHIGKAWGITFAVSLPLAFAFRAIVETTSTLLGRWLLLALYDGKATQATSVKGPRLGSSLA